MGTSISKKNQNEHIHKTNQTSPSISAEAYAVLASKTPFSVSEIESLYELFTKLSSSIVNDGLIHKTFKEADTKGDGKIDEDEWTEYAAKNPSLLKIMTLPYLMDISLSFPSCVLKSTAEESQL